MLPRTSRCWSLRTSPTSSRPGRTATDQLLRRVPYTATPAGAAFAAHECLDGSGYHRRVTGAHLDEVQRVIAAADSFQAMTCRIARIAPAHAPQDAAIELRAMSAAGRLDGEAVDRVLTESGC